MSPDDYQRDLHNTIKGADAEIVANAKREHGRQQGRATLEGLVKQQAAVGLLVSRFLAGDKDTADLLVAQHGTRDLAASALMAMHQQAAFDVRHVRQTLGLDRLVHAIVGVSADGRTLALVDVIACGKALEECNASAQWSKVGCRACWGSGQRPVLGQLGPDGKLAWTGEVDEVDEVVPPRLPPSRHRSVNAKRVSKDRAKRKAAKRSKRKGRR